MRHSCWRCPRSTAWHVHANNSRACRRDRGQSSPRGALLQVFALKILASSRLDLLWASSSSGCSSVIAPPRRIPLACFSKMAWSMLEPTTLHISSMQAATLTRPVDSGSLLRNSSSTRARRNELSILRTSGTMLVAKVSKLTPPLEDGDEGSRGDIGNVKGSSSSWASVASRASMRASMASMQRVKTASCSSRPTPPSPTSTQQW
mmetsp:Transcript_86635/g.280485  ORF Transcript_86635/g.280485 Transcript_86635/m.280485 type:complete len:205 (-) Transcript_86635:1192-1806(-)